MTTTERDVMAKVRAMLDSGHDLRTTLMSVQKAMRFATVERRAALVRAEAALVKMGGQVKLVTDGRMNARYERQVAALNGARWDASDRTRYDFHKGRPAGTWHQDCAFPGVGHVRAPLDPQCVHCGKPMGRR